MLCEDTCEGLVVLSWLKKHHTNPGLEWISFCLCRPVEQSWTFTSFFCSVLALNLGKFNPSHHLPHFLTCQALTGGLRKGIINPHTYVEETLLQQCLAFDKQLCSAEHSAACTHRPHVWGLVPQSGLAFAQNVPTWKGVICAFCGRVGGYLI